MFYLSPNLLYSIDRGCLMLKTSEVARKLNITNRQVQDLVDFGYLPIADTYRTNAGGFGYLFSEQALESLDDVPSLLAEIKDRKRGRRNISSSCGGWRRRQKVLERSERFLCSTADLPEAPLLGRHFTFFISTTTPRLIRMSRNVYTSLRTRCWLIWWVSFPR